MITRRQQQQQRLSAPPIVRSSSTSTIPSNYVMKDDTIGTVSTLQFGARRLLEIQALHQQTNNQNNHIHCISNIRNSNPTSAVLSVAVLQHSLQSGGKKRSSRHLRRRATSYQPKRKRRGASLIRQHTAIATTASLVDLQPPSLLETQPPPYLPSRRIRRQCNISNKNNDINTHLTWRTCHDHSSAASSNISSLAFDSPSLSPSATTAALATSSSVSSHQSHSTTHWMMTHIWCRKRFHMLRGWNWYLPMLHTNRGGVAAVRLVQQQPSNQRNTTSTNIISNVHNTTRSKCLIYDATWSVQPIWFRIRQPSSSSSSSSSSFMAEATTPSPDAVSEHKLRLPLLLQSILPDFDMDQHLKTKHMISHDGIIHDLSSPSSIHHNKNDNGSPHQPQRQQPKRAIGPVTWIYSPDVSLLDHDRDFSDSENKGNAHHYLYLIAHPSIQPRIRTLLDTFLQGSGSSSTTMTMTATEGMRCDGPYMGIQNGLTCLKLRGSNVSIVHCLCNSWFDLRGPKDQKKITMMMLMMMTTIVKMLLDHRCHRHW
jgi:Ribonucleases P/MRP protein subunit POP1